MERRFISLIVVAMLIAGIMITPALAIDNVSEDKALEDAAILAGAETAVSEASDAEETAVKDDRKDTIAKQAVIAPKRVKKVDARAKGKGRSLITWKKSRDADGYIIYMSHSKNGKYKKLKTIKNENKTKSVHRYKKLRKNKNYYYKVYAYKKAGGRYLVSKSSRKDPAKNTLSFKRTFKVKATAYSGGGLCANGKRCRVGRIAVDPRVIPLGTWLYVKGYGLCQACDTGGAIKGKRIDLYFNSEGRCNKYGVRSTRVYVLR